MGSNKQINDIFNECLELLITGKETMEQCLQRYPEYAAELEPLLRTAFMVNKAVDVKPSADFRAKARYQLHTMMAQAKAPKRAPAAVPRWAFVVCTVLLVFVLGGGTVLAADGATPGSPLYPVKLATENVRVQLTGSEEKKVELYAAIADRRVTEMTQMVDSGNTTYLEESAQRLNVYYEKIGELSAGKSSDTAMLTAPQPTQAAEATTVETTKSAVSAPIASVPGTQTDLPAKSLPPEETYSALDRNDGATGGIQVASSDNEVATGNAKLKSILGYFAVTQPEKIRELLESDKVPEAVKPALRRALWASEHNYKQALDNLQ